MKYFKGSFLVAFIVLLGVFIVGGFKAVYIAILLSILEVSLSFDNAVVNAKVLESMNPLWQKRFILFGIPVAVFGMRFVLPIVIVSIINSMGFFESFYLSFNEPQKYKTILESSQNLIYAFGGAFLLMVFLDFFFDNDREEKWIKFLEENKTIDTISKINNVEMIISILIGVLLIYFTDSSSVAIAYFSGVLLYEIINSLDSFLTTDGIRNGFMGFIYLEVLDASFSFDGVIGAFALSSNIFIIMIGLGIGAMFVRSMTLYLVEKKSLAEFKYLEHGAHYAIFALSVIMFFKIFFEISEVVTGTIGIFFIILSAYHSKTERD